MGDRRGAYRVLVGRPDEKRPLQEPSLYGSIILKCILKKWNRGMDSIGLAQHRDRWRAVVNKVMNLRVP